MVKHLIISSSSLYWLLLDLVYSREFGCSAAYIMFLPSGVQDAAETRNLKNSVYTRLSTTLAMHALLFLGLVSFSFNEFTRAGYM